MALPRPSYDRAVPETILTEQRGDVLLITLNRPEKLNAWSTRMGRELSQALRDANASAEIGAIVVTGGPRVSRVPTSATRSPIARRPPPRRNQARRVRTSRSTGSTCACVRSR